VIHAGWFAKLRDSVRRHPDPDVRFVTYRTIVDFLVSISDDAVLA
jgi:hypothetical protein